MLVVQKLHRWHQTKLKAAIKALAGMNNNKGPSYHDMTHKGLTKKLSYNATFVWLPFKVHMWFDLTLEFTAGKIFLLIPHTI